MFKDRKDFEEALAKSLEGIKEKLEKKDRCWDGYEPTPGKKAYDKGSCQPVKKDDSAHEPGSPEDSAHDTMEGGSFEEELKGLTPEGKKKMLAHLREYKKNPKLWHRSEENKKKGQD